MNIKEAEKIVAAGRPRGCTDHAHGTWGLAETFDRICEKYKASGEYNQAAALLAERAR